MSREEYEVIYSTLLYEMTICWEEKTNDAVLAKMWHRDASSFSNLDINRFCCSNFYFVDLEITQEAYDQLFSIVRTILAGQEFAPMPSSTDSPEPTIKPTLESFVNAFDRERHLERMNLNIGKSIIFDAKKYFQHFGSPTAIIQASNINFRTLQERSTCASSLSSDHGEAYTRRYCHYKGGATETKSGCSNPNLLRPTSSRQAHLSAYNGHSSFSIARPGSPLPIVSQPLAHSC